MLYSFIKVIARLAIRIFCRKIIINKPAYLKETGPLLLAANHPNSFLDSIIIDTLFDQPVWSLARGDVFKKPFYIRLLNRLKILPIYRTSEGTGNLVENYKTFEACIGLFKKNAIVMIYSEAMSINEWKLRPLRKGTARLAFKTWEEDIPLRVLPVGINYSSFRRFGKNVFINFGELITANDIAIDQPDGFRNQAFNNLLEGQLRELVFEIPALDKDKQKLVLNRRPAVFERIVLMIPAIAGWISHAPLYLPLRAFTRDRTKHNDHYDSVLTALLFVTYPFYLLLFALIGLLVYGWWLALLSFLTLPILAWCYVRLKPQLDN